MPDPTGGRIAFVPPRYGTEIVGGSEAVMREINSLFSGAPGIIGMLPDFAGLLASAGRSNLSFALRTSSSGP